MAGRPEPALAVIEDLIAGGELESYRPLHVARADVLSRLGRLDEAATSFRRALELSANEVDRRFLEAKLAELGAGQSYRTVPRLADDRKGRKFGSPRP